MDLTELRRHCLSKPGTRDEYPFGPRVLVMKVGGKMFAIIQEEDPLAVSLKVEPEIAIVLRRMHDAVKPGYHLNKRHWNTVTLNDSIPDELIREWIDDSYDLVLSGLPRRIRAEIR